MSTLVKFAPALLTGLVCLCQQTYSFPIPPRQAPGKEKKVEPPVKVFGTTKEFEDAGGMIVKYRPGEVEATVKFCQSAGLKVDATSKVALMVRCSWPKAGLTQAVDKLKSRPDLVEYLQPDAIITVDLFPPAFGEGVVKLDVFPRLVEQKIEKLTVIPRIVK